MGLKKSDGLNFADFSDTRGVIEKRNMYPVIWKGTYSISTASGSRFNIFNVDRNKLFGYFGGYSGGLKIVSIDNTGTSYTIVANISGSTDANMPTYSNVAQDDSFVISYNPTAKTLWYIPVNSNYTIGTPIISEQLASVGASVEAPVIINSTTFALFDKTNNLIHIYKLDNGAIAETKTISVTNVVNIGELGGNLVLLLGSSTSDTGVRIIDVDTETTLYEDIRTSNIDKVSSCFSKDNYLFVTCAYSSTPYVTTPILIYEFADGQYNKKNITVNNYIAQSITVNSSAVRVAKTDNKYIVTQATESYDLQVLVCDLTKNTVDTTFAINEKNYALFAAVATVNNTDKVFLYKSEGSYPSYTRLYFGNMSFTKVSTEIEYKSNSYTMVSLGEA